MKSVTALPFVLVLACLSALPANAEDLLSDDGFDDAEFDDATFEETAFTNEDTDALLERSPYQIWTAYGLIYDPKSTPKPANHYADFHFEAETTLGLSGFADVDLIASQDWLTGELDTQIYSTTLQLSTEQGAIKLGRYLNSWGEVEGAGVLDVVNPVLGLTDVNRGFKPQWLVGYNHYMADREVSIFANVQPDVSAMSGIVVSEETPREWGLRYKVTGSGSDWAVYMGQFLQNAPSLGLSGVDLTVKAFEYDLLGFSFNQAQGDDLFKLDVAWKQGLGQQVGTSLTKVDRLDVALGAEINDGDRQWNLSLTGNYLPNHNSNYQTVTFNPATMQVALLATGQLTSRYGIGVSDSFASDEYSWNVNLVGALNGNMTGLISELAWHYSDDLIWRFTAAAMVADLDSLYALADGTQRLGLQVEYHF